MKTKKSQLVEHIFVCACMMIMIFILYKLYIIFLQSHLHIYTIIEKFEVN